MTDNAEKHVQGFGSKVTGAAALFWGLGKLRKVPT